MGAQYFRQNRNYLLSILLLSVTIQEQQAHTNAILKSNRRVKYENS